MRKPKTPPTVPVLVRLPPELVKRTDAKAARLAAESPGQRVTRTDVIRRALDAYLRDS